MSSFRISGQKTVVVSPTPPGLPPSQDTQVLTNVNGQNIFSYPGYNYKGNNMFPENDFNTTTFSNITGTVYRQGSAALSPNGSIYFSPFGGWASLNGATRIMKINTYNETYSYIDVSNNGNYGYGGTVCADNGVIYMLPWSGSNTPNTVLTVDTLNNDRIRIVDVSGVTNSSHMGLVNFNNFLYAIPTTSKNIIRINPVDNSSTVIISNINDISTDLSSNSAFRGGVVGTDGKIYCVPYGATRLIRFSPVTNIVEISPTTDVSGYSGGVLAPNGKIYLLPQRANNIGIVDISNFTVDKSLTTYIPINGGAPLNISSLAGANITKYNGGLLAQNGQIYCIPYGTSTWLRIDTSNNIARAFATSPASGSDNFSGAALGPNGKIYVAPLNRDYVPIIKTGLPALTGWQLAPTFNHTM